MDPHEQGHLIMISQRARRLLALILLCLGAAACSSQTNDNFENPPPGPPASCTASSAVVGCEGGSLGYVCTSDRPDDGDTNLVCSDGTPGADGVTIYCCAPYGQYWSDCTVDTSVPGCVADSFGFTCSGPEAPGDADASIVCSAGIPSGSNTVYCCSSAVLVPTCAADPTVTGCSSPAIGYSCEGTASPGDSEMSLACTVGMADGTGATQRCCLPFPQSADACHEDGAVTGCAPGSYGFSCAGLTTPAQESPVLQCNSTAPGVFCCDLAKG
jgi:hypothetical protein